MLAVACATEANQNFLEIFQSSVRLILAKNTGPVSTTIMALAGN